MNIKSLLSLYALVVAAVTCNAQTIDVSWGNDAELRAFASSDGSLLQVGSLLRLGTFSAGTDFANTSYSYMDSQFTQYGVAAIGDGGYDIAGYFVGLPAKAPTSTKLFIWSFDAASAATATQWGIFSNSGSTWTTGGTAPDILNMDINQANIANVGRFETVGSMSYAMTTAVPEPATYAAILGFVTLGLVSYRRFRRR